MRRIAGVAAFAAILSLLVGAGAVVGVLPEKDGAWLVAGPFPNGAISGLEDGLDRDYLAASGLSKAGEAAASPLRLGSPGSKSWIDARGREENEGVDFVSSLGPASNSVAYAYRDFNSPSPRVVSLKIGSDDGVKVWVNGEPLLARHERRALAADEDAVAVSLVRGRNRILVKVSQAEGAWGFALRLVPLEEEAKAAARARITALAAYPDELAVPAGAEIRGAVMTRPA